MLISKLKCVQHKFVFNDGSIVLWSPINANGKGHDMFRMSINLQDETGGTIHTEEKQGPPSAATSLHWLKWAIKERKG